MHSPHPPAQLNISIAEVVLANRIRGGFTGLEISRVVPVRIAVYRALMGSGLSTGCNSLMKWMCDIMIQFIFGDVHPAHGQLPLALRYTTPIQESPTHVETRNAEYARFYGRQISSD